VRRKWQLRRLSGVACALAVVTGVCLIGGATPASASKAPILLGFIGDLTGGNASSFADGPAAAQARIDVANAHGGVNGHMLKLVVEDTQSSDTVAATAAQLLVSKGVFGVMSGSAQMPLADPIFQKAGIPQTGYPVDATWGQQPYSNEFGWPGTSSPSPSDTVIGTEAFQLLKSKGVKKLALLGYGGIPQVTQLLEQEAKFAPKEGISICLLDTSVPIGTADFTTQVLQMKQAGCDGASTAFADSSAIAFSQALKNAGLNLKVNISAEGYDTDVLGSAINKAAMQGTYVNAFVAFTPPPNAATKAMLTDLEKYDPAFKAGDLPDLGLYSGWFSTDLMIQGLELAGANPTRSAFITNLRKVTNYTAGGVLPGPVSFAHFGTLQEIPKVSCIYFPQLKGNHFVIPGDKPYCGKNIIITSPS
jgi:branched-chain amino acid transport system substrate-binding protein